MEELLTSVNIRLNKMKEIEELVAPLTESTKTQNKVDVYDLIRKYKDEEKNRVEKENWIINIMRNIRLLSSDQQIHIYQKSFDIMKLINIDFDGAVTTQSIQRKIFLEEYFSLNERFFYSIGKGCLIKVQTRQGVKQGNVHIITDLLKLLLQCSRQDFKTCIDIYSSLMQEGKGKQDTGNEGKHIEQKSSLRVVNDRANSVNNIFTKATENTTNLSSIKTFGAKHIKSTHQYSVLMQNREVDKIMISKDMNNDESTLQSANYSRNFKLLSQPKPSSKLQKKSLSPKKPKDTIYVSNQIEEYPCLSTNENSQNKFDEKSQSQNNNIGYFANIVSVVNDLDEQFVTVIQYQSQKRNNLTTDEFKGIIDQYYEKTRMRNIYIQGTCSEYRNYALKRQLDGEKDVIQHLKQLFNSLNGDLDTWHFCLKTIRPDNNSDCECSKPGYNNKVTAKSKYSSPIKQINIQSKSFIVKKQSQSQTIKKNLQNLTNQSNSLNQESKSNINFNNNYLSSYNTILQSQVKETLQDPPLLKIKQIPKQQPKAILQIRQLQFQLSNYEVSQSTADLYEKMIQEIPFNQQMLERANLIQNNYNQRSNSANLKKQYQPNQRLITSIVSGNMQPTKNEPYYEQLNPESRNSPFNVQGYHCKNTKIKKSFLINSLKPVD